MTKCETMVVLFMMVLPWVAGCDIDEASPYPAGARGEGEGEGEGAPLPGEGEEGEGEGEGATGEGEGEGEGPVVCPCSSDADCDDGDFCSGEEYCDGCYCRMTAPSCDDAVQCTQDGCRDGACIFTPMHDRCPDGQICRPAEGGCVAPPPCRDDADCVPDDLCQAGACDEATRACAFAPLDGDHDGHQPRVCGGDDCDDGNPLVFPGAEELCNNADDDCDGDADEGLDLREDHENCGSCGNRCAFFLVCRDGQCQCEEEGFSPCDADQCDRGGFFCDDGCFNLQNDRDNCGACGGLCENPELVCRDSDCQCPDEGELLCEDEFGDITCISVQNDSMNCGACGRVCGDHEHCTDGECRGPECAPGQQFCEWWDWEEDETVAACVDTMNSDQNCGACGFACPDGVTCRNGLCPCADAGLTACRGIGCVDLENDLANCGSCGNVCPANRVDRCIEGRCACRRDPRTTLCGDRCVFLQNDHENCGVCGVACAENQICTDGLCEACGEHEMGCATPFGPLQCLNVQEDSNNCGACGFFCGIGHCTAGTCICEDGATLCGGSCVDLTNDYENCGRCGNACQDYEECLEGACQCQYDHCGDRCIDLQYDLENCGRCGHRCRENEYCENGRCVE